MAIASSLFKLLVLISSYNIYVNFLPNPLHSLTTGSWFKLICGASYQHLPAIRSLAIAYSLAGADCIDVAADPAVINAATEGISVATKLTGGKTKPWLMVSINDGEDPHFRKAQFDATLCPQDCPQPCVAVCPAEAIAPTQIPNEYSGVIDRLCYGCGRCLPICPEELITTRSYLVKVSEVVRWIDTVAIDAIEIHTQVGNYADFKQVWQQLAPKVNQLKVLAISCSDAPGVIDYLRRLYQLISPLPVPLIWQTDGRSMSGDIGKGTTHAAIAFADKVLQANLPGYVQLAGGTNNYTVPKLQAAHLLKPQNLAQIKSDRPNLASVAGVAYGSYARSLLAPILAKLEPDSERIGVSPSEQTPAINQLVQQLENNPQILNLAVDQARELILPLKSATSQYLASSS